MKHAPTGMVEADITINGQTLNFAESMTLRVAISCFLMSLTSEEGRTLLGPIADGYVVHLGNVQTYLFKNQP